MARSRRGMRRSGARSWRGTGRGTGWSPARFGGRAGGCCGSGSMSWRGNGRHGSCAGWKTFFDRMGRGLRFKVEGLRGAAAGSAEAFGLAGWCPVVTDRRYRRRGGPPRSQARVNQGPCRDVPIQTCAFAEASPKPKNPRSARPQNFLKSSDIQQRTPMVKWPRLRGGEAGAMGALRQALTGYWWPFWLSGRTGPGWIGAGWWWRC